MATFTYTGEGVRIFPTISVVVKPGEKFEAPDDFSAVDVTPIKSKSNPKNEESENGSTK